MGDRYWITIKCAWCDKLNEEVYYASSSDANTFSCEDCGRENLIEINFEAIKYKKIILKPTKKPK